MSLKRSMDILLAISSVVALSTACGKKKKTSEDAEAASYKVKFGIIAANGSSSTSTGLNLADAASDYASVNILSGAPDELRIKVKAITLVQSEKAPLTSVPIFTDAEGKEISIKGNSVNISDLFTKIDCVDTKGNAVTPPAGKTCRCGLDKDGNFIDPVAGVDELGTAVSYCPAHTDGSTLPQGVMELKQEGTFNTLKMKLSSVAKVKGCVSGKMRNSGYINDHTQSTAYTVCTQSALGIKSATTNPTSVLTDFSSALGKTAETTDYLINYNSDDFEMEFPINGSVTIGSDSEPKLTLVIDTNRMLRFFSPNAADSSGSQTPNPGMPSTGSYFFNTVFNSSTFVFVGEPGKVQGYEYVGYAVRGDSLPTGGISNYKCSNDSGTGCHPRKGWITMIFDKDGLPMLFNVSPDDDNAGYKGANFGQTGIDRTLITANQTTATNKDLKFSVTKASSTLYNMDLSGAVGTTQSNNILVEFDATVNSKYEYSELAITRKL